MAPTDLPFVAELIDVLDLAVMTVVHRHTDDLVIVLAVILKVDHADDPSLLDDETHRQGLARDHENVELVAVLVEGLGDKSVAGGFGKYTRFHAVEREDFFVAAPFDFQGGTLRNFDDGGHKLAIFAKC